MHRRIVLVVVAAALLGGSAVTTHAASRSAGCVTIADAKGDAEAPPAALVRPPATAGVDIHAVTLRTRGETLVGAITVGDISQQPAASISTRMAFDFVLQKWAFTVFADIGPVPKAATEEVYYTQGIAVFDEIVSTNVQVTISGNTVSMAVPLAELESLRGQKVRGARLTELAASSDANYGPRNSFLYPHQTFDTVQAPRAVTAVLGATC